MKIDRGWLKISLPCKAIRVTPMKKILLLSDTHGYIDERILHYATTVDEVWHAGDIGGANVTNALKELKPLRGVYGNIDEAGLRKEFPEHQRFVCEGAAVWITHIGGYPGNYTPKLREELQKNPPGVFICGHSHILKVMWDKKLKLLHLNPGAAGIYGFHTVRTMLLFSIEKGMVKDVNIVELGKRG